MDWIKSSFSFANGNCVEAAGNWRKSSASNFNGNCAEVGQDGAVVGVRDSQLAESPVLTFSTAAWERFTAQVKRGT